MDDLRHHKNDKLFIIGLISLILGFALLGFTLYLAPNLLLGWHYTIPDFFMNWANWLELYSNYSDLEAAKALLLILFIVSVIFVLIAYVTSNMMDKELYKQQVVDPEIPKRKKKISHEGLDLGLKLFIIIIFVFILAAAFEWMIYSPPSVNAMNTFVTSPQWQVVDNN